MRVHHRGTHPCDVVITGDGPAELGAGLTLCRAPVHPCTRAPVHPEPEAQAAEHVLGEHRHGSTP
ncbi:hypothetical protein [Nocardiopsis dassonvillei]|uniref:hypothetical protein n=1 Tax=Nocardiopsis dassonvillei TaxID=2014 RepID=UPI000F8478B4|nr:hypothetical protein [Nocardiopsis dassonvillei]NKY80804.1 hypothetical protein [Nocardiopsis dassonvillei]